MLITINRLNIKQTLIKCCSVPFYVYLLVFMISFLSCFWHSQIDLFLQIDYAIKRSIKTIEEEIMNQKQYPLYQQYRENHNLKAQTILKNQNAEITTNGICKKFIHGKCKLADNCQYSHDRKHIKPCATFLNMGQCKYGDKCNFMHDLKICPQFLNGNCEKGDYCQLRHIFKSCPNFDMGFCFNGPNCKLRHIVRKLCWDYTLGFCQKGNQCADYHPKSFIQQDFQGTKKLFEKLKRKQVKYIVCNYCSQIGHKANRCSKKLQLQGDQLIRCGSCGMVHALVQDCNEQIGS